MKKQEFVLNLIKLSKPEFYNKVTWLVVISGLALFATPLWEEILRELLDKEYNLNLIEEGNSLWGFLLVLLGLSYHLVSNFLLKFLEYKDKNIKEKRVRQHDLKIFNLSQNMWTEQQRNYFFIDLLDEHSYRRGRREKARNYYNFLTSLENKYIDDALQNAVNQAIKSLGELLDWLPLNFFRYPDEQGAHGVGTKYCMYPDLCVDRNGSGNLKEMERYNDFETKLDGLCSDYDTSYEKYRMLVKRKLFV